MSQFAFQLYSVYSKKAFILRNEDYAKRPRIAFSRKTSFLITLLQQQFIPDKSASDYFTFPSQQLHLGKDMKKHLMT